LKDGAPSIIEAFHAGLEEEEEGDSSSMRKRIKRFCWGGRVFLGRRLDRVGKFLNEY